MRTAKQEKVLTAAMSVFLRYGYKRVNMSDIAVAANISRPALYLMFRNKEDVFTGVFERWIDETLAEIERELPSHASSREQVSVIFELWAVRSFEAVLQSAEARELMDCTFEFARQSLETSYERLEALLVPVIEPLIKKRAREAGMTARKAAHVLTAAVRGFKQAAADADELRMLIANLVVLWLD